MNITKSKGVTETERLLADLCERTFLKLWSYPNPVKDDGHELCDLLVVFEKHVFIFFDRENKLVNTVEKDPGVLWKRWKRSVIDAQIKTAHGAGRYIASGRSIYLDGKRQVPFPLSIDVNEMVIHKIIIAHGAKEACKNFSDANVYGSLAVKYSSGHSQSQYPFIIGIDKENPVHVFDSHNLPIIFNELDTVFDFSMYLDSKLQAIATFDSLIYCGEEDLLAHYYANFDENAKCHFIGPKDIGINTVMIGEGEWKDFIELDLYKETKQANKISYMWDDLIQLTSQNKLDDKLLGDNDILKGRSAIHEMAKEPRFMRRALSNRIQQAIQNFPDYTDALTRYLTFIQSYYSDKGYVFLQLWAIQAIREKNDYREKRQTLLEIACGAAKNKFPNLKTVIGISIDAPKFAKENAEDFILMDCEDWTEVRKSHYESLNKDLKFFQISTQINMQNVKEFLSN